MRLLLFFARVAFIFNLFFIACLIFRYRDVVTYQSVKGFLIVAGWILAPVVNFIYVLTFIIGRLTNKLSPVNFLTMLSGFNLILLVAQLIIIFLI